VYLYPYLRTSNKLAPYEDLRLGTLGVIAATVKVFDTLYYYMRIFFVLKFVFERENV
jgi:hypothetical protein